MWRFLLASAPPPPPPSPPPPMREAWRGGGGRQGRDDSERGTRDALTSIHRRRIVLQKGDAVRVKQGELQNLLGKVAPAPHPPPPPPAAAAAAAFPRRRQRATFWQRARFGRALDGG